MRPKFRDILISTSFLSLCGPVANAENGALAYAYSADNIVIDGDLSNWPEVSRSFPITTEVQGPVGFDARFHAAFNAERGELYIALIVEDEDHVLDGQGNDFDAFGQDTHLLYIDPAHDQRGSGAILFGATDYRIEEDDQSTSWDIEKNKLSGFDIEKAVAHADGELVYEWRLRIGGAIQAGRSIGIDHIIVDADEGNAQFSMWGDFIPKRERAARLGDLVLLDPEIPLGRLTGQVKWADGVPGRPLDRTRLRIVSAESPELWVQISADGDGQYDVELPAGTYTVSSPFALHKTPSEEDYDDVPYDLRLADDAFVEAAVVAGEITQAPVFEWRTKQAPALPDHGPVMFDLTRDKVADFEAVIEELMAYYDVTGSSVAVVTDGEISYLGNFGYRNGLTEDPVIDSTLFEAGSVTKIAFAFAVNRLAEQGKIDLDKPLDEYLHFEDAAHDERHKLVTARHVLSHQTGLPNWPWMSETGRLDFAFDPGTGFSYSGAAFEYLGRVMVEIEGRPISEILKTEFQMPMGQTGNTLFYDDGTLLDRVAYGHDLNRATMPAMPADIGVAYSMQTNALALSNFMTALIRGDGLSEEGYRAMYTPQVEATYKEAEMGWTIEYGLGFKIVETPYGRMIGHTGLNGSNNALFEFYEDEDSGFIVLTNSSTGREFYRAVRRYLLGAVEAE